MEKQGLYEKLIEYGKDGNYGFHMPGHKRNEKLLDGMDPFDIDITEITEFDNLHYATGVIKDAMDNAAEYKGVERTWFLVNGSTCGILAAIHSVTDIGDSIIVGRNCHKAVYHAMALRNLNAQYLYPDYIEQYGIQGGYNPQKLESLLKENKEVKAVVITSPTYDGIVSNVMAMAEISHKYGAVLIVDQAHGAHFGICEELPEPAYKLGADLVIESTHKTLPALTQTALLHLGGDKVNVQKVERCLGIYETSSPSYVLMASIDHCIRQLQKTGKERMQALLMADNQFRENVQNLKYIKIPGKELIGSHSVYDIDLTKLLIYVNQNICSGKELADILRERYHFEMEMAAENYVLAITTISDDDREIIRLGESLREIDQNLQQSQNAEDRETGFSEQKADKNFCIEKIARKGNTFNIAKNVSRCSIYEAEKSEMEMVEIENSEGRISGEFLYLYPPGIPLIVPGEVISGELLEQIRKFKDFNMQLQGIQDKENHIICVLKNR